MPYAFPLLSIVVRLVWLIPIVVFYWLLVRFGQNIPDADDFQATLNFIYVFFFTGKSTSEQWSLVFSQHNEHRIVSSRLISLAQYCFTGHINLASLLWVQQLFWLMFVALLVRIGQMVRVWQSVWVGLPVVLLLFNPNTFDTILNVWGGSQTYPTLLFTLIALVTLNRYNTNSSAYYWLGISILAATLATFSFGSGFLVWVGGTIYLFFGRRYIALTGWLIAAATAIMFYLWRYETPVHNVDMAQPVIERAISTIKFIVIFPGASFMARWPSPTLAFPNLLLCYSIGALSWLYAFYLLVTGYGFKNQLLASLLGVSLATCLLLAFGRSGMGSTGAFVSRYQLFVNLVPLVFYLILIDQQTKFTRLSYVVTIFLALVNVSTFLQVWPSLEKAYAQKEQGIKQWALHRTPTLSIEPRQQQAADERLRHSLEAGIFHISLRDKR